MSHFSVLVIGGNPEGQLSKYDENLELPLHLVETKEQIIARERAWIESYKNGIYAEFLADPEKYKEECSNEPHIHFLEESFPKMLEWTDEECYESVISEYRRYIEEGEDWCWIDRRGNLWKKTNENAKWDWYQLGGRFRGLLHLKKGAEPLRDLYNGWQYKDDEEYSTLKEKGYCDCALKGDIENWLDEKFDFFAVVKDGEWYERGQMGFWALVSNEKSQDVWREELARILEDVTDEEMVSVYDCHI